MQSSEALFKQPQKQLVTYEVSTGNCYDSVIAQNLNTGLPKKLSFITDKHLKGKKVVEQTEE